MPFANKNLNALRPQATQKKASSSSRVAGRSGFAVIQGGERRVAKPVGAAAAPTPVNTQSLRRENHGNDTSVNLVPVGTTSVWGKDSEGTKDPATENQVDPAASPTTKTAPWARSGDDSGENA